MVTRRAVLGAAGPVRDDAAFYAEERTNHYSRILHEFTTDGPIYGFASTTSRGSRRSTRSPRPPSSSCG
jgi:hypothetical protein